MLGHGSCGRCMGNCNFTMGWVSCYPLDPTRSKQSEIVFSKRKDWTSIWILYTGHQFARGIRFLSSWNLTELLVVTAHFHSGRIYTVPQNLLYLNSALTFTCPIKLLLSSGETKFYNYSLPNIYQQSTVLTIMPSLLLCCLRLLVVVKHLGFLSEMLSQGGASPLWEVRCIKVCLPRLPFTCNSSTYWCWRHAIQSSQYTLYLLNHRMKASDKATHDVSDDV